MYRLHTILLFLTILWSSGYAQEEPLSISEWKALLSVKEDIGAVNLTKALQKITTLDTAQYCETMTRLWEEVERKNIRLHFYYAVPRSRYPYHYIGTISSILLL